MVQALLPTLYLLAAIAHTAIEQGLLPNREEMGHIPAIVTISFLNLTDS